MIKEAILLAGGFGTRLQKVVPELPKPLAPVNGKPFIEYLMDFLIRHNIRKFILSVGYKQEAFALHFADGYKGSQILFSVENEPLGTGGGIVKALDFTESEDILVINADTLFRINISSLYLFHHKNESEFTIALRQMEDVSRYGSVNIDENNRVIGFSEKNSKTGSGYINGGVYLLKKDFFKNLNLSLKFSLEKDCLEQYYNSKKIYGFPSFGYFLDIGIPEDYKKAQNELKEL